MRTPSAEQAETIKEYREWATFGLSLLAAIAIPIGIIILRAERLEMRMYVRETFVSKDEAHGTAERQDKVNQTMSSQIGLLSGKLDSLTLQQVRIEDSIAVLKEMVASKQR